MSQTAAAVEGAAVVDGDMLRSLRAAATATEMATLKSTAIGTVTTGTGMSAQRLMQPSRGAAARRRAAERMANPARRRRPDANQINEAQLGVVCGAALVEMVSKLDPKVVLAAEGLLELLLLLTLPPVLLWRSGSKALMVAGVPWSVIWNLCGESLATSMPWPPQCCPNKPVAALLDGSMHRCGMPWG